MVKIDLYKLSKELVEKDATEQAITGNYNRIKDLYKGIQELGFEITNFPSKDQCALLKEMLIIKDSEDIIFAKVNLNYKMPNRNLISNLQKNDVDLNLEHLIDYFVKKIKPSVPKLIKFNNELFKNEEKKLDELIQKNIRQSDNIEFSTKKNKEDYQVCLEKLNGKLLDLIKKFKLGTYDLKIAFGLLNIYCEKYSMLFLQSVMYQIIHKSNLDKNLKTTSLAKIEKILISCLEVLNIKSSISEDIFFDFTIFLLQILKRREMQTTIEIYNILENEINSNPRLFDQVTDEYACKKRYISELNNKKELIKIVYEGDHEKYDRFNTKEQLCIKAIEVLNNEKGRQLNYTYLQHFKVVYREIFLSSEKYYGKNARTIVKNMDKPENFEGFATEKDYYFLSHKISRGMFREIGLLDEFIYKNRIETLYYKIILGICCNCDIDTQIQRILNFTEFVSNIMFEIFNDISEKID